MARYVFDEQGAKRIVDTVRKSEQNQPGIVAKRRTISRQQVGFWAKITARSGAKYSWTALVFDSDGTASVNADVGQGDAGDATGFAVEVEGSTEVETDTVVWMSKAKGQGFYTFQAFPEPEEPEDVFLKALLTDNLTAGGSAGLDEPFTDITVLDAVLPDGYYLPSGTKIVAGFFDDAWYVIAANACPSEVE